MSRLGRIVPLLAVCIVLLAGSAHAGLPFELNVRQTYASVGLEVTTYQFVAQLRSPVAGSDQLYVVFEPHVPESWFAQWCQTSTHLCFFGSHAITIPGGGVPDTLQVDFFTMPGEPEKGWVDIQVYRVSDQAEYHEATFALGLGMTLPAPTFTWTCANPFRTANVGDVVEIFSPLRSTNSFNDELICTDRPVYPSGWFAEYCQTSTHICHIGRSVIPFPAGVRDTLRIDFFTDPAIPGVGHYRVKVQSAANPAIWRALDFGVMAGNVPSAVETNPITGKFSVRMEPNPVRSRADFLITVGNPAAVRIAVFDASGRQVVSREQFLPSPGTHRVNWDARGDGGRILPRGTYFYTVNDGTREARGKLIISR